MKPCQTLRTPGAAIVLVVWCLTATAINDAAATAPAVDHSIPPDYVTLFPSWQRGFIVDDRLIHAAGENGIMQALFSTAMDGPPGQGSRVLLPFTHLDSEARTPGRPGPSAANSIHPSLPPLLFCWDVDHDQVMLVFGRMRPVHDFYLRVYGLNSIGGPIREIPSAVGLQHRQRHPDSDPNLADHL